MTDFSRPNKKKETTSKTRSKSPAQSGDNTTTGQSEPAIDLDQLTRADIMQLQRTIGNQAVIKLLEGRSRSNGDGESASEQTTPNSGGESTPIQREMTKRSERAFETSRAVNASDFGTAAYNLVDANVTVDEQKKINTVRGRGWHSKSPEDEKTLKDVLRAYLLKNYAWIIANKYKTKPKKDQTKKARKRYFARTMQERDRQSGIVSKGFSHPETQSWLKHYGFESIIPKGTKLETGKPRIEVRDTFISGMDLRAHLYILLTTPESKQYYFRGGPDDSNMTVAHYGEYNPGAVDWDTGGGSKEILSGDEVMEYLDKLIEAAKSIDPMKVPYESGGPFKTSENCNAAAYTMLKRAGLPTKAPMGVHSGFGHILGTQSGKGNDPTEPPDYSGKGLKYEINKDDAKIFFDHEQLEKAPNLKDGTKVQVMMSESQLYGSSLAPIKTKDDKVFYTYTENLRQDLSDIPTGKKMMGHHGAPFYARDGEEPAGGYFPGNEEIEVLDSAFVKEPVIGKQLILVKYVDDLTSTVKVLRLPAYVFFEAGLTGLSGDTAKDELSKDIKSEPHGDPIEKFLKSIPEKRKFKVDVDTDVFNPDDEFSVVGQVHKDDIVHVLDEYFDEGAIPADWSDTPINIRYFDFLNDKLVDGQVQAWFLKKAT